MSAGEQITLQPALAEMLAQHLHHPAILSQVNIVRLGALHPDPFGHLEHRIEAV